MKPVFPTYILKLHAKRSMRGRIFKVLAVNLIPLLIMGVIMTIAMGYMPGGYDSFKLMVNGNFASQEARMAYMDDVFTNILYMQNALSILFAFLSVGCVKVNLDIIRGKEFKIKDVFCYYDKWYIALVYPLATLVIVSIISGGLSLLEAAGLNSDMVSVIAWVLNIALYIVQLKLIFVYYTLADINCENVWQAVKTAWNMTGTHTVVNDIILAFSFIGWFVLGIITSGIALIYAYPYYQLSVAALYEANVRYNEQKKNSESE